MVAFLSGNGIDHYLKCIHFSYSRVIHGQNKHTFWLTKSPFAIFIIKNRQIFKVFNLKWFENLTLWISMSPLASEII